MAFEQIILADKGHIRIITLSRPKVLNALNKRMLLELEKALMEIESNKGIRCVIITGAGEKSFVAGADVLEMKSMNPIEAEIFSSLGHRVFDMIGSLRIPVIAAINGYALGGGLELALACDFIFASENSSFGLVETKLGLIPGFGGIGRLSRRVGVSLAKEMIFASVQISATEALRVGLINHLVSEGEVVQAARSLAEKIAERGPLAVAASKKLLKETEESSLSVTNSLEKSAFALLFASRDHHEGINAFLDKRTPSYEGI